MCLSNPESRVGNRLDTMDDVIAGRLNWLEAQVID